jgi:phosphoglycerate kinase
MDLKFVDDPSIELKGKRVLARFDFNVPLNDKGEITDTNRIDSALKTISFLLEKGVDKMVLMSHLGRPDGKPNPKYSLEPVAKYLAEKLNIDVILTESALDGGIKQLLNLSTTKIVLLENLRFHPEEEENDSGFAKRLSAYGEIFIQDAFGTLHRKHASTYGVVEFFKNRAYGGLLLKEELNALEKITNRPIKPFVAILGGSKISDKIKVISRLLPNVDSMLIGGAMAYPFLKAKGEDVGKSKCKDEDVELARSILNSNTGKTKIHLPIDHIVSESLEGAPSTVDRIPANKMGLDIGPSTVKNYGNILKSAKTVIWNGPMGVFENKNFAQGTNKIAQILTNLSAFTLVGGGDSVSAINSLGVADKISYVSTGGGASLEFIEEGSLPGVNVLKYGVSS